ncbi:alpha-amylase family glycosyl hydrolase [Amaricoccus macauensis]|uniref:alpha-amylase family glycosyl hydrolase n=1 Tax=Amaricoccus macauensis TaxID=57001 RepID=UPI003C7A1085
MRNLTTETDPYTPEPFVKITHPEWTKSGAIYELNLRQFTVEGTFEAAKAQLPRIKALGACVVWLMPIHPIGEENRKGSLGSPYAISDHLGVNPEFGTFEDLRSFVAAAHNLGLRVILDWVANHTAWDNPLRHEHPEWYARDWQGNFRPTPWWDWHDIIDLDYSNLDLRRYMTDAMKFWVREADVDGFRCDVAGHVPIDFWNNARRELDEIKPVFLLAEWEQRDMHARAFDATYAWSWWDIMSRIASRDADVFALYVYYSQNECGWPAEAQRMIHVENHDKNAWEGTQFEAMGDALIPAIALSVLGEGIPLIHNGQEAGNPKRLSFFEKDPIAWREHEIGRLYQHLLTFRMRNSALWAAPWGARMVLVVNDAPGKALSFVRQNAESKVFVVMNFSADALGLSFEESLYHGDYLDFDSGKSVSLGDNTRLELAPWSFRAFAA